MTNQIDLEKQFHEAVRNKDPILREVFLNSIPLEGTLISRLVYGYNDKTAGSENRVNFLNGALASAPRFSTFRQFFHGKGEK